eukprot:5626825-Amphidinium_carterae.1
MECLALGKALWDFHTFIRRRHEQMSESYRCSECRTRHYKWAQSHGSWACLNCEYHKKLVGAREACDRHRVAVRIQQ